ESSSSTIRRSGCSSSSAAERTDTSGRGTSRSSTGPSISTESARRPIVAGSRPSVHNAGPGGIMIRLLARIVLIALLAATGPLAEPAAPLQVQHNATSADGMLGDRFTWTDASGNERQAVLVYNDGQTGPGGSRGGELREFRYKLPGNVTRTVNATGGGDGGFGYVVSHPTDTAVCLGLIDSSSLGHFTTGTFT